MTILMKKIAFFTVLVCLVSCNIDPKKLEGNWQATAFYQDGQSVSVPLDSVGLSFGADGSYTFRTIGFFRESGTFQTSGKYLILQANMLASTPDKRVLIDFLDEKTLKIKMNSAGKVQHLFLERK
jgi:hypothetical protein